MENPAEPLFFFVVVVVVSYVFPLLQPVCLPRLSLSRSMSLSLLISFRCFERSYSPVSSSECFRVAAEPRPDFGILHKVHNEAFPLVSTPFPLTPSPLSPLNLWPSGEVWGCMPLLQIEHLFIQEKRKKERSGSVGLPAIPRYPQPLPLSRQTREQQSANRIFLWQNAEVCEIK